jgi:hypothetical protein
MLANQNWKEECQEKVKEALLEANKKLPEKLRSIIIDTDDSGPSTIYELKGPMGQKTWESRPAWSTTVITDIRKEEKNTIIFSLSDYITPQGTICKSCSDEFVNKITKIFTSVSSTKSVKKHEKMHEKIKEKYYEVFEEMVLKAIDKQTK